MCRELEKEAVFSENFIISSCPIMAIIQHGVIAFPYQSGSSFESLLGAHVIGFEKNYIYYTIARNPNLTKFPAVREIKFQTSHIVPFPR